MKAAIVFEPGKNPIYSDFRDPAPQDGEGLITVTAAALSNIVKSRASGAHYSSSNRFPFVVGVDGVGRLEDGRRVYFVLPRAPFGTMSEKTVVSPSQFITLPDELDDVTAAAIANPGMSSWVALIERARLVVGETVLINGATGTSGRLAVQIAKYLGASRVIATGRNLDVLSSLESLGADVTIPLKDNLEERLKEQFSGYGIDVVLDYLWGESAERIIFAGAKAGKEAVPIRFVHIGAVSASDITLPSAALRSSAIQLMGSGIGSVPFDRTIKSVDGLFQATIPGGFRIETQTIPLSQVEEVWSTAGSGPRVVFQLA